MSHFVTIKTQIKDIEALKSACSELGLAVLQNAKARGYGGSEVQADHVIRLKGPFDVALNQQKDKTFALSTDWWGGHVEKEIGKDYTKLMQLYAVHKAIREAKKKGHLVKRQNQQDGSIKLVIQGC